MSQNMHENSLQTWDEEEGRLSKRAEKILAYCRDWDWLKTDREIQAGLGYAERGMVQPRLSDLIKAGFATECGRKKCDVTGKQVRLVRAVHISEWFSGQMDLL